MDIIHHSGQAFGLFENLKLAVRAGTAFHQFTHIADGMPAAEMIYHIVHKIKQLIDQYPGIYLFFFTKVNEPAIVRVGALELSPSTRVVRRNGKPVTLTQKEYALLEYLMRRPGVVLSRPMIAELVWHFTFDLASNVVDVYIKHLRDKIDDPGQPSFIQTVRGVGYTFRDPAAVAT